MKLNLLFLVVVISILTACGSKKQAVTTETSQETRSEVREVYRDTMLFAAPQSSELQINVSELCANYKKQKATSVNPNKQTQATKQYQSQNGDAYVDAEIVQDLLTIRGGCDTIALKAKLKERYEKQINNLKSKYSKESKRGVSTIRLIYTSLIVGIIGIGIGVVASKFSLI